MIKHHYYFKILEFSIANYYSLQDFHLLLQIVIPLQYFAMNLVFLQRKPPPQKNLISVPKYPIATVWSSKNLSLTFIQKYPVYCPKNILSTLSNPTHWNPNSTLVTEFTLPVEDKKEAFNINGGDIDSWEESLQRRGYYLYWASRSGFVWGWPYLQGIIRMSGMHEFLSKNLGVPSASH